MRAWARALVVAVAAVVVLAAEGPAGAQELPRGQLGMATQFRKNLGPMAERYGFGYLWGFFAGYQVTRPDEPLSLGVTWMTLFGSSQFFETLSGDDPSIASGALSYLEMSLGLRIRYALSDALPVYVSAIGGAALMRTDVPIPPDAGRLYAGGLAGAALEYQLLGSLLVGLETRYGLIGAGPQGLSFMVSAGFGR